MAVSVKHSLGLLLGAHPIRHMALTTRRPIKIIIAVGGKDLNHLLYPELFRFYCWSMLYSLFFTKHLSITRYSVR